MAISAYSEPAGNLSIFSDEYLLEFFSYLEAHDLYHLSFVCKKISNLVKDRMLIINIINKCDNNIYKINRVFSNYRRIQYCFLNSIDDLNAASLNKLGEKFSVVTHFNLQWLLKNNKNSLTPNLLKSIQTQFVHLCSFRVTSINVEEEIKDEHLLEFVKCEKRLLQIELHNFTSITLEGYKRMFSTATQLQSVHLNTKIWSNELVEEVLKIKGLSELVIQGHSKGLTDNALTKIENSNLPLQRLEILLYNQHNLSTDALLSCLRKVKNLVSFSVTGFPPLTNHFLKTLVENSPKIEVIYLSNTQINVEGLKAITVIATELIDLTLIHTDEAKEIRAFINTSKPFPKLRSHSIKSHEE